MNEEKKLQNKIIKYYRALEKNGEPYFINRRQSGGFSYKKGIP